MTANLEPRPRCCVRLLPPGGRFGAFTAIHGRNVGLLVLLAFVLSCSAPARAERKEAPPRDLDEVVVQEHLNDRLPLDLSFVDHDGQAVKLGDYFDGELPVILTLNYSSCPMLCSLQLEGLFDGLKKMNMRLGEKYRMVTVSIDPTEPTERAAMTREKYLKRYGRPGSGAGYTCLVGKNKEIKQLADAIGFGYRYRSGDRRVCSHGGHHDLHA